MSAEKPPDLVALARAGDPAALNTLRALWPEALAQQRTFVVDEAGCIYDPLVTGPRWRHEVWPKLTPFVRRVLGLPDLALPGPAVADVRRYPPLVARFADACMAHITAVEARLILDDTLTGAVKRKLRQQLTALHAPGRSFWENWVRQTPDWKHRQFDEIVKQWLAEPVQLAEAAWFVKDWQTRPYSAVEARRYFEPLDEDLLRFLGVRLRGVSMGSQKYDCAFAAESGEHAKRGAISAELPVQFICIRSSLFDARNRVRPGPSSTRGEGGAGVTQDSGTPPPWTPEEAKVLQTMFRNEDILRSFRPPPASGKTGSATAPRRSAEKA